jgi:hypothetical protein
MKHSALLASVKGAWQRVIGSNNFVSCKRRSVERWFHMIEGGAEPHIWGLGRHAIGSNWFWYLRDPAGNYVEYIADLDSITAQDLSASKDGVDKEYLYAYGPAIPAQFIEPSDAEEIFAA